MRLNLFLWIFLIAGLITSCTRDSTNIETDNPTDQKTNEVKEITTYFGFSTKGSVSIEEETEGGGSVNVINNPKYDGYYLGIQLKETETNKIVAGGLFKLGEVDLSDLSTRLVIGREYEVESTLMKSYMTNATYWCFHDSERNIYEPMKNKSSWDKESSLYKFKDLHWFYFYAKTYYIKQAFVAGESTISLDMDLQSAGFKFVLDIPYGYKLGLFNGVFWSQKQDMYCANALVDFSDVDCEPNKIYWYSLREVSDDYLSFQVYLKPPNTIKYFPINQEKTESSKRTIERGRVYTIKVKYEEPHKPVIFKDGKVLTEYFNYVWKNSCYCTSDKKIKHKCLNFKEKALKNPDDWNSNKRIIGFVVDNVNSAKEVLPINDEINDNNVVSFYFNYGAPNYVIMIIDNKYLNLGNYETSKYQYYLNNCDDAFSGWTCGGESGDSCWSNPMNSTKDFDTKTGLWSKVE